MRIGVSALAMQGTVEQLDSGVARYCAGLIEAWVEHDGGHEFQIWIAPGFEPPASWKLNPRVTFHQAHGAWAGRKTLWELFAAGKAALESTSDVWFSTAHAVPWKSSVPTVLSVQDLFTFTHPEFYTWKHRLVIGWAMRRSVERADRLVAISRHTENELERLFQVTPGHIQVTPLGLGRHLAAVAAEGVDDGELRRLGVGEGPYLLTLSTVEPRKNLERLFAAFAELVKEPEWRDLRLVVAGKSGWKTAPIYRRPEELGVADRVDFVGFVADQDLPKLFARARAFVLPSIIEGFGLPLLEAMSLGVPIAASATGALVEVGGEVPEYFDPLAVEDMLEALRRVLDAEGGDRPRSEAAVARAAEFTWERTAAATLKAIEAAAETGSAGGGR